MNIITINELVPGEIILTNQLLHIRDIFHEVPRDIWLKAFLESFTNVPCCLDCHRTISLNSFVASNYSCKLLRCVRELSHSILRAKNKETKEIKYYLYNQSKYRMYL